MTIITNILGKNKKRSFKEFKQDYEREEEIIERILENETKDR